MRWIVLPVYFAIFISFLCPIRLHANYHVTQKRHPHVYLAPHQLVNAHNKIRFMLGLQPLTWSDYLARFSQQWADFLKRQHGCHMQHRPLQGPNHTDYGENLFWGSALRWTDGTTEVQRIDGSDVVREWSDEQRFYDYHSNSCARGQQCGHYTQIVWRDTSQVGCGVAVCGDNSQVWVCSYHPAGNWIGEKPY